MYTAHCDPTIMVKTFTVLAGTGKVAASQMLESTMGWEEALINELRQRLERDGYLLIRQFLPSADILTVCIPGVGRRILSYDPHHWISHTHAHLQARSFLLEALKCNLDAPPEKRRKIGLIDRQHLALSQPVLSVLESPLLFSLMEKLIVRTPRYFSVPIDCNQPFAAFTSLVSHMNWRCIGLYTWGNVRLLWEWHRSCTHMPLIKYPALRGRRSSLQHTSG